MLSPLQLATPPDAKGVPLADWQAAELRRQFQQFYATDRGAWKARCEADSKSHDRRFVPWDQRAVWNKRDDYGRKSA